MNENNQDNAPAASDEFALRQKARDAIGAGRLPVAKPTAIWGGPGTGKNCAVCSEAVRRDGLGFEIEFAPERSGEPPVRNVHVRCFAAWEFESQRVLPDDADSGTISSRERENNSCEQRST